MRHIKETDEWAKYEKYWLQVDPKLFLQKLIERVDSYFEIIERAKKELFKLKKDQLKSKDLKQLNKIETDIFWAENRIKSEQNKIYLITELFGELGWDIWYQKERLDTLKENWK
jgi:hypothetical protein